MPDKAPESFTTTTTTIIGCALAGMAFATTLGVS